MTGIKRLTKSIIVQCRNCDNCGVRGNTHFPGDYGPYKQDNSMMTRRKKLCKTCGGPTYLAKMETKVTPYVEDSLADILAGKIPRALSTNTTITKIK